MFRDLGGELTRVMIGAGIAVHRELGPGLDEPDYEMAFRAQLLSQGIEHAYQRPLPLIYKGIKLDCGYRMDVVIEQRLVVELKSVETLLPVHEAQLLTYLRLTGIELGLLLNFDVEVLKNGIRRRALSTPWRPVVKGKKDFDAESFDELTSLILEAALEVHRNLGPGLLRSAYEAALCYELSHRQIAFERNKVLSLVFHDVRLDGVKVELLVDNRVPVVCLSLDVVNPIEKARLLSRLRQGNWRTGLILNFNVPFLRDGICRVVNRNVRNLDSGCI